MTVVDASIACDYCRTDTMITNSATESAGIDSSMHLP